MLSAQHVAGTTRRHPILIGRLRFQIAAMWFAAVLIPGLYVYLGFITAESNHAIMNSVLGALAASFFGLIVLRRMNDFPGMRSYSMILPSLACTYGLALVITFGLRLDYSRSVLTGSFVAAVVTAFALAYVVERAVKPLFFIVPGGDADTLNEIAEGRWVTMERPEVPQRGDATLVADFRHDHSAEWERILAKAAVDGRVVYHSKLLRESLTGAVTIEHLSENSFGSLVPNRAYLRIKRALDIAACLALLPFLLIPVVLIAVAIRLDSAGPVIFRQMRVGYRGRIFKMYKFRTMHPREVVLDADAARDDAMTRGEDQRITRIGRFLRRTRLDELPQLLNVLRGDMSWIGPRPEAVPLSEWYDSEIPFYSYRHIIRPGISGWAQVHLGHVTDLDAINRKLAYDFYYVKYFSAWLDIVIALRTIPTMIGGFGAR